MQFFSI